MTYQHAYRELCTGKWADPNPYRCPCRGTGWLVSDYDTYHRCPLHGGGAPHPEDDETVFDYNAHRIGMARIYWRLLRHEALTLGFEGDFTEACVATADKPPITPQAWVAAAERVAAPLAREHAEKDVRRRGYSCALELRLEEEAIRERKEKEQGLF